MKLRSSLISTGLLVAACLAGCESAHHNSCCCESACSSIPYSSTRIWSTSPSQPMPAAPEGMPTIPYEDAPPKPTEPEAAPPENEPDTAPPAEPKERDVRLRTTPSLLVLPR